MENKTIIIDTKNMPTSANENDVANKIVAEIKNLPDDDSVFIQGNTWRGYDIGRIRTGSPVSSTGFNYTREAKIVLDDDRNCFSSSTNFNFSLVSNLVYIMLKNEGYIVSNGSSALKIGYFRDWGYKVSKNGKKIYFYEDKECRGKGFTITGNSYPVLFKLENFPEPYGPAIIKARETYKACELNFIIKNLENITVVGVDKNGQITDLCIKEQINNTEKIKKFKNKEIYAKGIAHGMLIQSKVFLHCLNSEKYVQIKIPYNSAVLFVNVDEIPNVLSLDFEKYSDSKHCYFKIYNQMRGWKYYLGRNEEINKTFSQLVKAADKLPPESAAWVLEQSLII